MGMHRSYVSWQEKLGGSFRALGNYARGFALSPVRRWRCCYGAVPLHNTTCVHWRGPVRMDDD
jgi:hypothetical protein